MNLAEINIPIVDFAGFASADAVMREATVAALRAALESCGFMYLRNHGISQTQIDAVFAQSRAFFSLPQKTKDQTKPREKGSTRGYEGVGIQALDAGRPGDLKEIFQCGAEPATVRSNAWPGGMPEFRATLLGFLEAANVRCNELMKAIAVALGLPANFFEPYHDHNDSTLRLLHYPPLTGALAGGQLRAGAHTDFGGMSLLFQDDEDGLEIQSPGGRWIAAPALP